jgi:hypothetical protein
MNPVVEATKLAEKLEAAFVWGSVGVGYDPEIAKRILAKELEKFVTTRSLKRSN